MLNRQLTTLLAISVILAAACSDDDAKNDGSHRLDGGDITVIPDTSTTDRGQADGPVNDAGQHDLAPQADTPSPDLPQGPSGQIYAARTAADGTVSIAIEGVYVTYTKAAQGDDPAGFFIQYEKNGPALFVAVDPATLTPSPASGDLISLTVTEMATNQGRREATAVSGLSVTSSDNPLTGLIQDVTNAADLVTRLDSYDAELISLDATVSDAFAAAGSGFVSATIDTAAISGNGDLKLRLPQSLQQTLSLTTGCAFSLKGTPLWRYNSQAQPSAWVEADIEVKTCPAPKVVSAIAISATSVRVTFDRQVRPSSVNANGDQFTFDHGLTASAATVNGTEVDVTTSAQAEGTSYTVTVATTVTDTQGSNLDGSANTATFAGYQAGAKLLINELNVNIPNGCDLAELRVTEGGSLTGYKLLFRDSVALYFPPNMIVAKNDYIVVHFDANDSTFCYPTRPADETTAKNEQPSSTFAFNYDTAFDLYSTTPGLPATSATLSIVDASDQIVDALLYSDTISTPAGSTLDAADVIAAANAWTPVGGSARTSYDATTYVEDAAKDVDTNGSSASGRSLQRNSDADTDTRADWTDANNATWGANNAGQTDL